MFNSPYYVLIILSSVVGFLISTNIHFKKRTKKPFACPLKFRCDTVVHSDYSRLFGIPLEYLGMAYYFIVFASYFSFLLFPQIVQADKNFVYSIGLLTIVAFIISIYLTFVQAFLLKQWCSLCLASAAMCSIILLSVLKISPIPFPF